MCDVTEEKPRASDTGTCESKNRDYKALDMQLVQYRKLFALKVAVWFKQTKCFLS